MGAVEAVEAAETLEAVEAAEAATGWVVGLEEPAATLAPLAMPRRWLPAQMTARASHAPGERGVVPEACVESECCQAIVIETRGRHSRVAHLDVRHASPSWLALGENHWRERPALKLAYGVSTPHSST